jgi:hypothetical protein
MLAAESEGAGIGESSVRESGESLQSILAAVSSKLNGAMLSGLP